MTDGSPPILVIGATGQQGGAVARALLERGRTVHALVRDPDRPAARELRDAGAVLVTGDLDDRASLRAAMTDTPTVFLALTMMTGPRVTDAGVAAEERRGQAVCEVAAEVGVQHLVYSSIAGADPDAVDPTGVPHVDSKSRIEAHLARLGLATTILRPVFFMENFASFTRPQARDGALTVSLAVRPTTRLSMISIRDIGALGAMALDESERFAAGPTIIGGDILTGSEIAERFAAASRQPVLFRQTPLADVRAFDENVAAMFAWLDAGASQRPDLAALRALHPGLLTLAGWLDATGWEPRDGGLAA
jgi:uncharacterized protein YbjT (DUF2867 family)